MKSRRSGGAVVAGACLLLLTALVRAEDPSGAAAQPAGQDAASPVRPSRVSAQEAGKASTELLSLQNQIRQKRSDALAKRKASQDTIRDLGAEKRMVSRSLDALKEEIAKREKEIQDKRAKLAEEEKAIAKVQPLSDAILAALKVHLDRVEKLIEGGIPWKIEDRRKTIGLVRELVSGSDATPSAGLAAAGRIQQEEESLGRLVERGTVEISVGNQTTAVQAFHLGLIAVIFANEDGSVLGFAQAGQKLEDGIDTALGSGEAAYGYMAAVDILRRRRTPAIIDLFVPTLPMRKEGDSQ